MLRIWACIVTTVLLFVPLVSACGSNAASEPAAASESAEESSEVDFEDLEAFDPNNFDASSADITNQWLPLEPGVVWVFEGSTEEDGEIIPHSIEFTVSDLTKVIENVRTRVVWVQDFADEELVEAEIAFFAQDKDGNVWHFGEYPEEYEEGEFVDAPSWIAGIEGAQPGIAMKTEPRLGTPSYSQGWGPGVNWTDRGRVYQMGQQTCVPVDCFEDVLVIEEFNQEEPGAYQLKYYARGAGNVRVGWRGEGESHETLELVEHMKLEPEEAAEVNTAVIAMEKHAYEISEDVYGLTPPSESP